MKILSFIGCILGISILTCNHFEAIVGITPAFELLMISGNDQIGIVETQLPAPLRVQVLNQQKQAVAGIEVSFEPVDFLYGDITTPKPILTDEYGFAEAIWQLGTVLDTQRVTVSLAKMGEVEQLPRPLEFKAVGIADCPTSFEDKRDGTFYRAIRIGNQCWMAENLNVGEMVPNTTRLFDINGIQKHCYEDNAQNCLQYGGLYDWREATNQSICPIGWKLPSDEDFKTLERFLGMGAEVDSCGSQNCGRFSCGTRGTDQAYRLISPWENCPPCRQVEDTGFNALFAGECSTTGCGGLGEHAKFLTSSEFSPANCIIRVIDLDYRGQIECREKDKNNSYAIRCVKE